MVSEAGARGVIEACSCRMRPEFMSTTIAAAIVLPLERFLALAARAALEGAAIASASKSARHARACGPQKLFSSRNFTRPQGRSAPPLPFRIPNAPKKHELWRNLLARLGSEEG